MTELEKLEKELLEEIQEEPEIYADTEEFCTINPETRIITVPTSKRILGTESDQETNRLYFKCPKIVGDNVDLSLFSLRINYQNAGNKKDQYLVEDVKEEGDNITFSWLFKRNVTAYKGNVKFILCAVKTTEDGIIKNEWNTTLNTECESLEGMEVDKVAVEEETKDIVEQLIAMMNHSAENAVRAVEEAKAEVDKEVGDFALKAQQALADVNNAGQAQTERVQTAGNDAVESVKAAQGTATRAVETAKTEAIEAVQTEGTTQAGNVSAEGEKQVQAVQGAAQEIMADREQIQENKTGIAKLKEDIVGLDNRKADAIVETASGTPLDITDSVKLPIQNLRIFGKSEQVQTIGAQLFNAREALKSQIEKGIVSFDSDGKIILNGKFDSSNRQFSITLQPGTYTLSGDDNGIWYILAPTDGVFRQTLVVDVETTYQCYIASNTYNNHATAPMINIGETAKPYEPYTGGKPSPSPEYPQKITSSGDNGNIKTDVNTRNLFDINAVKKYEVDNTTLSLSVSGNKIIFNSKISTGKEVIRNVLNLQKDMLKLPPGKYMFSYKSNKPFGNTHGSDTVEMFVYVCKNNSTRLYDTGNKNWTQFEVKEGEAIYLRLDVNQGGQSAEFYDLMINKGESILPYEPYFNQSLALPSPNGLPGIKVDTGGNYTDATGQQWITDEIDLARGKYIQRIEKKIIKDMNLKYLGKTVEGNCKFFIEIEQYDTDIYIQRNIPSLCDIFKLGTSKNKFSYSTLYTSDWKGMSRVNFIVDESINTIEEFKKLVGEARFYYKLKEQIERDLPPETTEAFKSLYTNYPSTVISNDENAGMEVSYVADTKHYIDKKFEELNQAIVNTQIALL